MAKKKPRRFKRARKEEHPTLFVLEGSLQYYSEGSMLELHTLVKPEEWQQIVTETVQYMIFVQCLKEIAFPILHEQWTAEDDYYRLQLEIAVSRMRNIDALLVAGTKPDQIREAYVEKIQRNARETAEMIKQYRQDLLHRRSGGDSATVSNL